MVNLERGDVRELRTCSDFVSVSNTFASLQPMFLSSRQSWFACGEARAGAERGLERGKCFIGFRIFSANLYSLVFWCGRIVGVVNIFVLAVFRYG